MGGDALSSAQAERVNEYVALLNDLIGELAVEFGVTLVDLRLDNEALLGPPAHFSDCTHPNECGAEIIAARFAEALIRASGFGLQEMRARFPDA